MGDTVIRVKNIGKQYSIGQKASYNTLREAIANVATAPFKAFGGARNDNTGYFWALKDVSFEVEKGEVVGIIGRNGAGKSTLLKILSRITEPTEGSAEIYGRVGSLLEVGTGFHPELTGRENIYLSGAILGMKKIEIENKFDDIVKFADTEKFLDMPLKHYSSGMQVRLGFAVAANLDPEILIIDEVLAVGDAEFQKKCIGKMSSVANEGRTVLFVSHNMAAVQGLCHRGIVLKNGRLEYNDEVNKAIDYYISSIKEDYSKPINDRTDRSGNGKIRITEVKIFNKKDIETNHINMGEEFCVQISTAGMLKNAIIGVLIGNVFRTQLIRGYTWENLSNNINLECENNIIKCYFNEFPLMHGTYNIHIWIGQYHDVADFIENVATLNIEPKDVYNTGRLPDPLGGLAFCNIEWELNGVKL